MSIIAVTLYSWVISSPEYALKQTIDDVKSKGYSGLREHLTAKLAIELDGALFLGNAIFGSFKSSDVEYFLNEMDHFDWKYGGVTRGNKETDAKLSFSWLDMFSGEISIEMEKKDDSWKICGIDISEISWMNS